MIGWFVRFVGSLVTLVGWLVSQSVSHSFIHSVSQPVSQSVNSVFTTTIMSHKIPKFSTLSTETSQLISLLPIENTPLPAISHFSLPTAFLLPSITFAMRTKEN